MLPSRDVSNVTFRQVINCLWSRPLFYSVIIICYFYLLASYNKIFIMIAFYCWFSILISATKQTFFFSPWFPPSPIVSLLLAHGCRLKIRNLTSFFVCFFARLFILNERVLIVGYVLKIIIRYRPMWQEHFVYYYFFIIILIWTEENSWCRLVKLAR